jgi:MFS superfamily sulfate permease-like transporter
MLSNLLYIDPAATTVLLSSVTAIVVACGATFIILWRKIKKGAQKVLHFDENANKEVEDELVITDDEATEEVAEETVEATEEVVEEVAATEEMVETTEEEA